MTNTISAKLYDIISAFDYTGTLESAQPFGNGHINDTYKLVFDLGAEKKEQIILQKMNRTVFKKPIEVMENIVGVTSFLRKKIINYGGEPERETLNIIYTRDKKPYHVDSQGEYWRSFLFVRDASCYERVEKPDHFYQAAFAFGNFQRLLADYPADTLHETIEGFHDTKKRFAAFNKAVKEDIAGRVASVQREIEFVQSHENLADCFAELSTQGKLPLRVTHNDTKLNNIMIDNATGKGICVIDLDTVMPGLVMNDFGDSIRFGASTAAEDETDLDKVSCDVALFRLYADGFLKGLGGSLSPLETELLPMGAKVMTYECGMRFLTDYLQGDTYFKISRENHNLDRFHTQAKLLTDMESKWKQLNDIITDLIS